MGNSYSAKRNNNKAEEYASLGKRLMLELKFLEAVSAYTEAIRLNPNNAIYHNNLGSVYLELAEYAKALVAYKGAVRLDPNNAIYHCNLGNAYLELAEYGKALVAYKGAVRLDPNNAIYNHCIGNIYVNLEDYNNALTAYKESIRLNPSNAINYNNIALAYLGLKDQVNALGAYNESIRLDPNDANHHYNFGITYYKLKDYINAKKMFDNSILLKPNYSSAYVGLSKYYWIIRDYNKAFEFAETAMHHDKDSAEGYVARGLVRFKLGNIDEAVRDFTKATSLDPEYAIAYPYWAELLIEQGSYIEAEELLSKAEALNGKGYKVPLEFGRLHFYKGLYKESLAYLDRAREADKLEPQIYVYQGLAYNAINDHVKAIHALKEAIRLGNKLIIEQLVNNNNTGVSVRQLEDAQLLNCYLNLAHAYLNVYPTEPLNAVKTLEDVRAAEIGKDDTRYHTMLGISYFHKGQSSQQYDQAIHELRQAINLNNQNAEAHKYLGRIYLAQNKTSVTNEQSVKALEEARKALHESLKYEESQEVCKLLAEVYGKLDDKVNQATYITKANDLSNDDLPAMLMPIRVKSLLTDHQVKVNEEEIEQLKKQVQELTEDMLKQTTAIESQYRTEHDEVIRLLNPLITKENVLSANQQIRRAIYSNNSFKEFYDYFRPLMQSSYMSVQVLNHGAISANPGTFVQGGSALIKVAGYLSDMVSSIPMLGMASPIIEKIGELIDDNIRSRQIENILTILPSIEEMSLVADKLATKLINHYYDELDNMSTPSPKSSFDRMMKLQERLKNKIEGKKTRSAAEKFAEDKLEEALKLLSKGKVKAPDDKSVSSEEYADNIADNILIAMEIDPKAISNRLSNSNNISNNLSQNIASNNISNSTSINSNLTNSNSAHNSQFHQSNQSHLSVVIDPAANTNTISNPNSVSSSLNTPSATINSSTDNNTSPSSSSIAQGLNFSTHSPSVSRSNSFSTLSISKSCHGIIGQDTIAHRTINKLLALSNPDHEHRNDFAELDKKKELIKVIDKCVSRSHACRAADETRIEQIAQAIADALYGEILRSKKAENGKQFHDKGGLHFSHKTEEIATLKSTIEKVITEIIGNVSPRSHSSLLAVPQSPSLNPVNSANKNNNGNNANTNNTNTNSNTHNNSGISPSSTNANTSPNIATINQGATPLPASWAKTIQQSSNLNSTNKTSVRK